MAALDHRLQERASQDASAALGDAADLLRAGARGPLGLGWNGMESLRRLVNQYAAGPESVALLTSLGVVLGQGSIAGDSTDEIVLGSASSDSLYGNAGADLLAGGTGSDALSGGDGDDTYIINLGDGQDRIEESTSGGRDTLQLGAGITEATTELRREGYDLLLKFNDSDQVRVSNYFDSENRLESISFADGTSWDMAAVVQRLVYNGTEAGESISGLANYGNRLNGLGGNDYLYGGTKADYLDGGAGNDTLAGNNGNDTYLFGKGSGQDVINEYDSTAGNTDTVVLSGLNPADVTIVRELDAYGSATHLLIKVNGTNDQLRVQSHYANSSAQIEKLVFADDTTWGATELNTLPLIATGTYVNGTNNADTIDLRNAVNTSASGSYGNDTYLFGKGSGQDVINEYDSTAGNTDTVMLSGLNPADVTIVRELDNYGSATHLLIKVNGTNDQLRVQNQYSYSNYQIEKLVFADGTTWGTTELNTLPLIATGSYVNGTNNADTIDLRNAVNTSASGSYGSDTYLFGKGSGQDTITDGDSTAGNTDVAKFDADITADQLWFRHVGNNLEVSIIGTNDKLTLQNWYSGNAYHLEQFKTADGKLLLDSQIENLVSAMASFAPPPAGQTSLPQNYRDALTPTLAANWH
jgi:Ca2+-binding RTX toxin-like protein